MTTQLAAASFAELKKRIETPSGQVAVMGLGYVGLPSGFALHRPEIRVTGFDIDQRKVDTLLKGGSYIYRIPAAEIQEARAHGFEATSDYSLLDADGCDHHLRSHPAQRISRTRS